MIIAAWATSRWTQRPTTVTRLDAPLIQGLVTSKINSIVLGHGEDMVTLKKQKNSFVVTNKDNYPAQTEKINNLIASILDIRVNNLMTEYPDNFMDLEVSEDKARNVIKFLDDKDQLLAGVIIGKRDYDRQATYVRRLLPDESENNKVYTTSATPYLQTSALSYIDQDLFKVEKTDIARISATGPEGTYSITTDENNKIKMQNPIPPGKKLKGKDCEDVFNAVTDLTFDDVQKESEKTANLNFDHKYVCSLKDSTVCTFKLAQKGEKIYTKCAAQFTDPVKLTQQDVQNASEEELKKHDEKLKAQKAALDFTNKHHGWVYELPSWKARNMIKKFSDLLEDVEQKSDNDKKDQVKKTKSPPPAPAESKPAPAPQPQPQTKTDQQVSTPKEPAPDKPQPQTKAPAKPEQNKK